MLIGDFNATLQTTCTVRRAGHEEKIQMLRGLRQGCPLAPSVYAAWTVRLCKLLGDQWCREHTSFFADDVHGHSVTDGCEAFHAARRDIT